jgi:hypothetical protein
VVVAVILPLELALARDGEQAVFERHADVLFVDSRHFDLHEDLLVLLEHVHRRIPGRRPSLFLHEGIAEEGLEERRLEAAKVIKRVKTGNTSHDFDLPVCFI